MSALVLQILSLSSYFISENRVLDVKFEILIVVLLKIQVFWGMMLCHWVNIYQRLSSSSWSDVDCLTLKVKAG